MGAETKDLYLLAIDVDEDAIAPYETGEVDGTGVAASPVVPAWLDPADRPSEWIVPADVLNRWPVVDLGLERDLPYPLPGEHF